MQKDIQSWPSKTNNLHPEPHAPKSVIVRFELSSLDFSGQRKFASCLVAFRDPSSEDLIQMITCKIRPLTFNLEPSIIFLAIHDQ